MTLVRYWRCDACRTEAPTRTNGWFQVDSFAAIIGIMTTTTSWHFCSEECLNEIRQREGVLHLSPAIKGEPQKVQR